MPKRPRIALKVTDLDASLAFYIEGIGFELVESQPVAGTALILDSDGDPILLAGPQVEDVKVHLDEPRIVFKPGDTLDFVENDLDARRAGLAGKGLVGAQLEEDSWGDRKLTLKDPDGYTIVFVMSAKRSPEKMAALYAHCPTATTRTR